MGGCDLVWDSGNTGQQGRKAGEPQLRGRKPGSGEGGRCASTGAHPALTLVGTLGTQLARPVPPAPRLKGDDGSYPTARFDHGVGPRGLGTLPSVPRSACAHARARGVHVHRADTSPRGQSEAEWQRAAPGAGGQAKAGMGRGWASRPRLGSRTSAAEPQEPGGGPRAAADTCRRAAGGRVWKTGPRRLHRRAAGTPHGPGHGGGGSVQRNAGHRPARAA